MKKISCFLISSIIVSCGSTALMETSKAALYEVLIQQPDGGANINFYDILTEPNEIVMLQNDTKLKNKITPLDVIKSNFVILNMGEKSTGGYSIAVESVVETEKNIIIHVKESIPEPSAIVTQGFMYPFCVVKINSKKEIIIK